MPRGPNKRHASPGLQLPVCSSSLLCRRGHCKRLNRGTALRRTRKTRPPLSRDRVNGEKFLACAEIELRFRRWAAPSLLQRVSCRAGRAPAGPMPGSRQAAPPAGPRARAPPGARRSANPGSRAVRAPSGGCYGPGLWSVPPPLCDWWLRDRRGVLPACRQFSVALTRRLPNFCRWPSRFSRWDPLFVNCLASLPALPVVAFVVCRTHAKELVAARVALTGQYMMDARGECFDV